MRGAPNSKITLTIKRDGVDQPIELSMLREVIHIQVVKDRLEPDNIGYVRLTQFTEQADPALKQAVKALKQQAGGKLKALILDLRNNPGGLLDQAVAVSGDFINQGEIVSTRARHAEDAQRWDAKGNDIIDGVPLVVLINGGSASSSEIVAGALQDHQRAVLLGTRSFGKGSVQTVIPLPGNGAMRLTTARYYTPSGRSIQGEGIKPDVAVAESREDTPRFGPEREADLNHVLKNEGGTPDTPLRRGPICRRSPNRSRPSHRRGSRSSIRPNRTTPTSSCRRDWRWPRQWRGRTASSPTDLPVPAGLWQFFAGWRGLGRFWLLIASVLAACGIALQLAGPLAPPGPREASIQAPARSPPPSPVPSNLASQEAVKAPPAQRPGRDTPGPVADPDPALAEPAPGSTSDLLPRIAADGRMPMQVYAAGFDNTTRRPRVGLLLAEWGSIRTIAIRPSVPCPTASRSRSRPMLRTSGSC